MEKRLSRKIRVVAFDADDTLWRNESFFRQVENRYCELLCAFGDSQTISSQLFRTEMANLEKYGYGVKSFMLSMIETAVTVGGSRLPVKAVNEIIDLGKSLLSMPIELLDGVEETLKRLTPLYSLVVATKGDLLDQQSKLDRSGIAHYFHRTEIMSDKTERDYLGLIRSLGIEPDQFLMIGNSLKSDVYPVLSLGGNAIHIPFEITWQHEAAHDAPVAGDYITVASMSEVSLFL